MQVLQLLDVKSQTETKGTKKFNRFKIKQKNKTWNKK
jgi:hypothetical protein